MILFGNMTPQSLDMILVNSISFLAGSLAWILTHNSAISLLAVTLVYGISVTFLYTWYARAFDNEIVYYSTVLTTSDSVLITIEKSGKVYTKLVVISDVNDTIAKLAGEKGKAVDIVGYRRIEFSDDKEKQAIIQGIQETLDKDKKV